MHLTPFRAIVGALFAFGLASCGGGGGGGGGDMNDITAPTATVRSPKSTAMTDGAKATIVGTASDAGTIASVTVTNGVNSWNATSSNGFATWAAQVDVAPGTNNYTVRATDRSGNVNANAATATVVGSSHWVQRPGSIAHDPVGSRMVVCDSSHDAVLGVTSAGAIALLGGNDIGTGPSIDNMGDVTVLDGVAYVFDFVDSTITAIDLTTGAKDLISGGGAGSGTAFIALFGAGVDATRDRVLAFDFHQQSIPQQTRLMIVDRGTGARTLLSGNGAGAGVAMAAAGSLAHDTVNDRYIVVASGQVLAIHPVTGDRTELSGTSVGSGASISGARDVVLQSPTQALVLVASNTSNPRTFADIFVSVDLATGVRTAVTHSGVPTPPGLASGALDIDIDPTDGAVYLTESTGGKLYRITFGSPTDMATITEIEPSTASVGTGPRLSLHSGLAFDPAGQRFFTTERYPSQITAIDRATATRSIASSAGVGAGSGMNTPRRVEWDAANNRLLMVDQTSGDSVFAVNPSTGDRTLISADPAIASVGIAAASALDPTRNALLVGGTSSSELVRVDLTTGVATVVATLNNTNASSSQIVAIGYLASSDRYLVADEDGRVYSVSATSGNASVVMAADSTALDRAGSFAVVSSTLVYAYDTLDGEVVTLNPQSGSVSRVVFTPTVGTRGGGNQGNLVWDASEGLLYQADNGIHGLSVIHPATRDRLVLSR